MLDVVSSGNDAATVIIDHGKSISSSQLTDPRNEHIVSELWHAVARLSPPLVLVCCHEEFLNSTVVYIMSLIFLCFFFSFTYSQLCWVGDRLVPREYAKVSVFDSTVQGE